jgi:hypothetical protein
MLLIPCCDFLSLTVYLVKSRAQKFMPIPVPRPIIIYEETDEYSAEGWILKVSNGHP